MARMMPALLPADAPPGEKAIYRALQQSSETHSWLVLHSLWIANHVRQVEGEADFVVIVPETGILVIEVKSHLSIDRRSDGTWKLGNDKPTSRGPFQQASEAMHSLRNYLGGRVELRSIPMVSAVWFTGVRARSSLPSNPEWHDWQVMDSEDLKSVPQTILRTLAAGTRHLGDKIQYFDFGGVGPDDATAERIASHLRPKFELATVAGDRRRARETHLISFIDEQFLALDAAAENQSVLFSGPAGSGKSFLAQESARREAASGRRGRLLCFNRFLGKRMASDMAGTDGVTVGTFHQELLRIAGLDRAPANAGSHFWSDELPGRALDRLLNDESHASEYLVVDEIQDIATDLYLDVLDLMVEGGLKEGRILFFGDFERQSIFENQAGREIIRARAPYLSNHRLVQNCRNLPRIGFQVNLLSHLEPGYQQFRRDDDGVDPVFQLYRAGQDQSALLVSAIRSLKQEGFDLNEIVVLSPHRDSSTAATTDDPWLRQVLRPADGLPARPGQVHFATIHAFKGLEAPAVVITDLDRTTTADNFDALLYVGLTRATDRFIAIVEATTLRTALGGTR
ncbi:NERD domain-containing protein [Agromyces sp. PvR057]|uniref:nuclease-related domain-containing DEAD/DEAH box helicase n=1 Tax=Agromyces sp. PvR057 TaxID=3156403 RepID=UPI003397787A